MEGVPRRTAASVTLQARELLSGWRQFSAQFTGIWLALEDDFRTLGVLQIMPEFKTFDLRSTPSEVRGNPLVRLARFWARANYNRAKMRCMVRSLGWAFLCAVIAFVSCSQPANVQRVADIGASQLKNRIPPPNPSKYRSVRDARDWQNPYLMVQENGIRLITEMKRLQISQTHF